MEGTHRHPSAKALLVILVAVSVGACGSVSRSSSGSAQPAGGTLAKIENTAWRMASLNGGIVPATADVVLSSRQSSENTVGGGDQVDSDQRVYVVQMTGGFVANTASTPPGVATPIGGALSFNFDPATGEVTDWGVSPKPSDLYVLGQVFQIVPTPAPTPSPASQ